MKKFYFLIAILIAGFAFGQESTKSLEETKDYIIKTINQYAWDENSTKHRLKADFEGDFLQLTMMNKDFTKAVGNVRTFNFANVYRFRDIAKEPGDIAHLVMWLDERTNDKKDKWKKGAIDLETHNYEAGEQLLIALKHLNELLKSHESSVEKF